VARKTKVLRRRVPFKKPQETTSASVIRVRRRRRHWRDHRHQHHQQRKFIMPFSFSMKKGKGATAKKGASRSNTFSTMGRKSSGTNKLGKGLAVFSKSQEEATEAADLGARKAMNREIQAMQKAGRRKNLKTRVSRHLLIASLKCSRHARTGIRRQTAQPNALSTFDLDSGHHRLEKAAQH